MITGISLGWVKDDGCAAGKALIPRFDGTPRRGEAKTRRQVVVEDALDTNSLLLQDSL